MILKYKGYEGTVEYSGHNHIYYGKIKGIDDLITYEVDVIVSQRDTNALQREFEEAVDDYIKTCEQLNRKPQVKGE